MTVPLRMICNYTNYGVSQCKLTSYLQTDAYMVDSLSTVYILGLQLGLQLWLTSLKRQPKFLVS